LFLKLILLFYIILLLAGCSSGTARTSSPPIEPITFQKLGKNLNSQTIGNLFVSSGKLYLSTENDSGERQNYLTIGLDASSNSDFTNHVITAPNAETYSISGLLLVENNTGYLYLPVKNLNALGLNSSTKRNKK